MTPSLPIRNSGYKGEVLLLSNEYPQFSPLSIQSYVKQQVNMAQAPQNMTGYQHDDAWDQGHLRVDDIHEVYYEQYGKKDGKPGELMLFLVLIDCALRNTRFSYHCIRTTPLTPQQ
jgi:hypothetical protein